MGTLGTSELIVISLIVAALAAAVAFFVGRSGRAPAIPESEEEKRRILDAATAEAQARKQKADVEAREAAQKIRSEAEVELRKRRQDLDEKNAEINAKNQALDRKDKELRTERDELARKEKSLKSREEAAETVARTAATQATEAKARLERIAGLTAAEARKALEIEVKDEVRKSAAEEVGRIEAEARAQAEDKARMILAAAVQRYASEYVTERTVSVVPLPSDDLKGRIIGREGRNIRALEAATGIDLIIDDTPEAVVISCFNPVRREIARLALQRMIADGRIHPSRIEEMVEKATQEIEGQCKEAGEKAIFDLGIGRVHPELVRLLGKLKYRSNQAQNVLQHSIEVGFLAGSIAGELGMNVKLARRAGLLHDIGMAVDQERDGSHAEVGAQLARKFDEPPEVMNAIGYHHGNVGDGDGRSVLDHIVDAANVISSQRPGARREVLETYVQRLTDLEKVATSFKGVEKAFAIQAGKEVRVLVENAQVSDQEARLLARDIARKIESDVAYPGQVRVSVVRETRATDYAR